MSELVRCDVSQARGIGRPVQFFPYRVLREPISVVDEEKIRWCSGAGMDHGSTG